ncbi:DMT family transporter [Candidatus Daviesbacteria bacterium]|nr:DMT family transporter [Candidatus Daviesbacteria bacterium]
MSSQIVKKPLPYIALLVSHLIWGASFVVAKLTLEEIPPSSLAFLRFAVASLFLAPFFLAETTRPSFGGKKVTIKKEDLPTLVAIGVFIVTLNIVFFFEGMIRTTAINASVITLIIPVLSVLAGWWFLKEKIYLINLFGLTLGLMGALLIIGLPQIILGDYSLTTLFGNLLIFLASVSFVVGSVFSRRMLKKYPSLTVTAIAFIVGTVAFFVPALREYFVDPTWPTRVGAIGIFGIFYMALLSSISAYLLFEWGLAKTNITQAQLFQYIEPFVAAFFAVLILSEKITIPFLIGSVFIGIGVFLGTLAKEIHHKGYKFHRV